MTINLFEVRDALDAEDAKYFDLKKVRVWKLDRKGVTCLLKRTF